MKTTDWTLTPGAQHPGVTLRMARQACGFTLEQAGAMANVSASTVSRIETRGRDLTVSVLLRFAALYGLPPQMLGLSPLTAGPGGASLAANSDEDGEPPMRRRDLIAGTMAVAVATALPDAAAATAAVTVTLEDVLFGHLTVAPLPVQQLVAQTGAARADFLAARYTQAAHRLPRLLAHALASLHDAPEGERCAAAGRLATVYNIATQLLLKLHDDGMAAITSDRAVTTARASGDPVVVADAVRLAATVLRRNRHRDGAQRLVLRAADELRAATNLNETPQIAMFGQLLAVGAYTAAMRDDRATAWSLLAEADDAASQVGAGRAERFNKLDLAVYRISVARVLGDYGAAVDYARMVDPTQIRVPERRARFWEDTALALHGRGRPGDAFHALLAAERDTPQEVLHRPWAQQLARDLQAADTRNALPGLREFAQRVGVA